MLMSFTRAFALVFLIAQPVIALAEAKVPTTASDHLALAREYTEKAAGFKKEAQYHRDMIDAYKKSSTPPDKSGKPSPWVKKMSDHCQALIDAAEKMAAEETKMAEFHALRAKELQGK
jgi:hypothetical protein